MADPIELYRRDEMIEINQPDWHMALLIFREMGWKPERPFQSYTDALTFVRDDEGLAMGRAGKGLFSRIMKESFISASVQMDLGLFYTVTDFVGRGGFIVSKPGAYAKAKQSDF